MRALMMCAGLLLATGCAARVAVSEPVEAAGARDDARAKHEELMQLERSVAAQLDTPDGCEADLCGVAERVCELADAVCRIAGRHADDRELESRCADSETRCARARERVDAVCGCSSASSP